MKYCPECKSDLLVKTIEDIERLICSSSECEFVHWNNPIPVTAIIVEHNDKIILANNFNWPEHIYSIITGFLEKGESPEQGAIREVEEELGLIADSIELVGAYTFFRMNQIILGYYACASGTVKLNDELRSYKHVKKEDLKTWDSGTGYALRDWLHSQGYQPEEISFFKPDQKKTNRGTLYQRIDNMVQGIPEGQLATYGQIAKLVGACGARQVGYAMAALGDDSDVPWHRVINSQGRISARTGGEGHEYQRILLESEGIVFNDNGKVSLEIFRWVGPPPEE
jgi:alkylated DNA nucleotide flippase Atl1/ADP-ribose pyrophosphatase YjhB (NUDIX family)